jgi:hypothetical protein
VGGAHEEGHLCTICSLLFFSSSCLNLTAKLRWISANRLCRFECYDFF